LAGHTFPQEQKIDSLTLELAALQRSVCQPPSVVVTIPTQPAARDLAQNARDLHAGFNQDLQALHNKTASNLAIGLGQRDSLIRQLRYDLMAVQQRTEAAKTEAIEVASEAVVDLRDKIAGAVR
jgi:hypothetical protein